MEKPRKARMSSKFLLILVFLGSVSSDRLRFHLENLVDRNVSACDDFYHHVCSQQVDPNEFFFHRASSMFNEAIKRLHPDAIKNSPIEYDVQLTENDAIKFEENNYEHLVEARCKRNLLCYIEERQYYETLVKSLNTSQSISFDSNQTRDENVETVVAETLKVIRSLVEFVNIPSKELKRSDMKTNKTYGDFHEIKEIAETLKNKMISNINATAWLHGDEISDFIRQKIEERVASIQLFHDFDETDKNITIVKKLNRDFNEIYFSINRDTGIRRLDVMLKLTHAFVKLFNETSPEIKVFIYRIAYNFKFNAFFEDETKTVTMLAPFMQRNLLHSVILREPFHTYYVLGHELYHSLFSPGSPTLLKLFESKTNCITDHYSKSVPVKAASTQSLRTDLTWNLYASSIRVYTRLRDNYSADKLNTKIDGVETTLEQAFFYYVASGSCRKDRTRSEELAKEDPHSAKNIRINAALSLMPEFTRAFKCRKDDRMFVEEQRSCYVLGPKS